MLSKKVVKNLVYFFYFFRGKYPPGTAYSNFEQLTMGQLQIDDPALPSDPDFEKKKLSVELQHQFFQLGYRLPSPLEKMRKASLSLGEFHEWCHENHKELPK